MDFVCHGGWTPSSAKILQGRRATGPVGVEADFENAGANWMDEPAEAGGDGRQPHFQPHAEDPAAFARAMLAFFSKREAGDV